MTTKSQTVDTAIKALIEGGVEHAESFRNLIELVYDSGYMYGLSDIKITKKSFDQTLGCKVCGIGSDGRAYGYVCNRGDCPTRVTYF